jgi:hypothetical protein
MRAATRQIEITETLRIPLMNSDLHRDDVCMFAVSPFMSIPSFLCINMFVESGSMLTVVTKSLHDSINGHDQIGYILINVTPGNIETYCKNRTSNQGDIPGRLPRQDVGAVLA